MPNKFAEQMITFFKKLGINCVPNSVQTMKDATSFTATLSPTLEKSK